MNYINLVYKLDEVFGGRTGAGTKIITNIFIKNKKTNVIFKGVVDAISEGKKEYDGRKIPSSVKNAFKHIYSFDMDTIKITAGRRKGKYDYNDDKFKSLVNDLLTINNFIDNYKNIKKAEKKEPRITYREALKVWNEVNHPNMYCTPTKGSDSWKEVEALRIKKKYAD